MEPVLVIGDYSFSLTQTLLGAVICLLLVLCAIMLRARPARVSVLADELRGLSSMQAETSGRVMMLADALSTRQAELSRSVSERLDGLSSRLGHSLEVQTRATHDSLSKLGERLVLIDNAQKTITSLTSEVVSLKDVLANKQSRGAFGQGRMEAIIRDALPASSYAFQFTLKNGKRPDCVIFLPNDPAPLTIDAKFPLEAVTAFRTASAPETRKAAATQLKSDIARHVADIAERYLVPGETQDMSLMFVPSESIYADLHEFFEEVVQKAYRARVILVSPSLLMLAIQVVQQLVRDARTREQIHLIRGEVGHLTGDITRLRDRVEALQKHFAKAQGDIEGIMTSTDKIMRRSTRIDGLEWQEDSPADPDPSVLSFREPRTIGERF